MSLAPSSRSPPPPSPAGSPAADRRHAQTVAAAAGLVLGLVLASLSPALAAIDAERLAAVRTFVALGGLACGLLTGAFAVWRARVDPGGVRRAFRLGIRILLAGGSSSIVAAAALAGRLGGAWAAALALANLGLATGVALLAAVAAAAEPDSGTRIAQAERDAERDERATVPLRVLLATTCGALALAAWSLASSHVLGTRLADGQRLALDEARDLVAIAAAARPLASEDDAWIDGVAARAAPSGGFLVTVDEEGEVAAGAGADVAPGTPVHVGASRCRVAGRVLACAVRRVGAERRLVAAVPAPSLSLALGLAFALAGLVVVTIAASVGALVGAAPARELERVAARLDELVRGRSLDIARPIAIASLDEVGDLAAGLDRLRARLEPTLSQYRDALDRAQTADRARDEFLSLVSAELRAPIDELIAATDALLAPEAEPLAPAQADDVRTVRSAARHLSDLIDEVLDISAIASGRITLRLAKVDLGELAADVAKTQRPLLSKKGVELKVDVDQPSPSVIADERRLRQVLMNLCSNAVKFTEKGEIAIAVRRQSGGTVEITVRDTGPGIAADALPRLFQEFVQLGTLKQRARGTGLGLAICKRLVEAHGGEISAKSELGRGSTFRVVVPAIGPAQERTA